MCVCALAFDVCLLVLARLTACLIDLNVSLSCVVDMGGTGGVLKVPSQQTGQRANMQASERKTDEQTGRQASKE